MAADSILAGISQEATQQELVGTAVLLLSAILEKLPRVDAADRLLVSHAESNPTVSIAANQSLANVQQVGARDATHVPASIALAGATYIYDNIKVS